MKRCETSLTQSGPRHADGSRPCLVRALMRRTPTTCMLIWRCTEQVIVIAFANNAPRAPAKLSLQVSNIESGEGVMRTSRTLRVFGVAALSLAVAGSGGSVHARRAPSQPLSATAIGQVACSQATLRMTRAATFKAE